MYASEVVRVYRCVMALVIVEEFSSYILKGNLRISPLAVLYIPGSLARRRLVRRLLENGSLSFHYEGYFNVCAVLGYFSIFYLSGEAYHMYTHYVSDRFCCFFYGLPDGVLPAFSEVPTSSIIFTTVITFYIHFPSISVLPPSRLVNPK